MSRQANLYDKVLRENLEAIIPGLLKNVLGIIAVESEELPDDRSVGPATAHEGT